MKKNDTVSFIFLFIASISGGFALKNFFTYSVTVGFGLAIIFLFCAAYFAGKNQQN